MTKFASTKTYRPKAPTGVIQTIATAPAATPDTTTYEGAPAFSRTTKSELFLLAVTNMVGEGTFYEAGKSRDARFTTLIHKVVNEDPSWVASFIPYLRDTLNMRTAAVVMAAEYVKAGGPNGRKVVASALRRAEEPSVLLAYWKETYGKNLPQPIKRGVADAVLRLYNEKSFIKYDSDTLTPRFGDVIELTHPKPLTPWQHSLFKYAIDKRHNRADLDRNIEALATVKRFRELMALPVPERRALVEKAAESKDFSGLDGAGLTWENLSGWLQGPMDAKAWEAIIPQMGYMALLRNLRNFDDAGISVETRNAVIAKLTDPAEVAASRQLPLRFYSAYKNVASAHWTSALETALDLTLANVPSLKGRTLVLVDISGSMNDPLSSGNTRRFASGESRGPLRWEVAALFGSAVAVRAEKADLFAFSDTHTRADFRKGASILRTMEQFGHWEHSGTDTFGALAGTFKDHDRVVLVTDEQANYWGQSGGGLGSSFGFQLYRTDRDSQKALVAAIKVPIYVFNLAGYKQGVTFNEEARQYTFGGLTDNAFKAIESLEAFKDEKWPWEMAS
jgi:hypothetical protein